MRFEDDFMFAPPVAEAYVEQFDRKVYWLNGTFQEHNELMKLISDDEKRQIGWEKVVYNLACDENGKLLYKKKVSMTDFHAKVNHNWARTYGMLILGIGEGDKLSKFELEVDDNVKKSEQERQDRTS